MIIEIKFIVSALIFSFIGLVIFVVGFILFDRLTPYDLWREIVEKQNLALSIMVGSYAIGIAMIIAAAVG